MPADPRKRQKKLERKAADRKAKRQQLARLQSVGFAEQLSAAASGPIVESLISDTLADQGMGSVVLSRQMRNGALAYAIFLVDAYCLGVKNVILGIASRFDYESRLQRVRTVENLSAISPAGLRKYVEGAVAYAERFGLHPHPDYARARRLFGDIDPGEYPENFEYGKDGKPLFIAGPHDTLHRCQTILRTLEASAGRNQFDYIMEVGGAQANVLRLNDDDFEEIESQEDNEDDGPPSTM
jgi:hypothetical protein